MPEAPDIGEPVRTCVGCRRRRSQRELIRIALKADGTPAVGRTLPGRGAWLCADDPTCLETAARRGGFDRAFRTSVPKDRIEALRAELTLSGEQA